MRGEKTEDVSERGTHKGRGGRVAAAVSILLLVPIVRELRERRHRHQHHRFPLLGH